MKLESAETPKLAVLFLLTACAIALSMGSPGTALASSLSAHDWKVAGDQFLTFDSITSLEWLDVTQSTNRSFNDVQSQFGEGGDFEGFRYASVPELIAFFSDAGIDPVGLRTTGNYLPVFTLLQLVGITQPSPGVEDTTIGLTGTECGPGRLCSAAIDVSQQELTGVAQPFSGSSLPTNFNPLLGSFLLREAPVSSVPEPSTWLLFGSGLAGLVGWRRKQAHSIGQCGLRELLIDTARYVGTVGLWGVLTLVLGLLVSPTSANAAPLSLITSSDAGLVVYDPMTGNEWLPFNNPLNTHQTIAAWNSALSGGGVLGTFAFANQSAILGLLADSGTTLGATSGLTAVNNLSALATLMGGTIFSCPGCYPAAYLPYINGGAFYSTPLDAQYTHFILNVTGDSDQFGNSTIVVTASQIGILGGSNGWLVRNSEVSAVPEPSTWLLLGSGLVGLALWRRKRTA